MKRFSIGLIALGLAVGAVAFAEIKKADDPQLFWYKRTAANTYVEDHSPNTATEAPSTPCSGSGQICVKGFLMVKVAATIKDTTTAQTQQPKTP